MGADTNLTSMRLSTVQNLHNMPHFNTDFDVTWSFCCPHIFFYLGILQRNYRKMTMKRSFSYNSFVKLSLKHDSLISGFLLMDQIYTQTKKKRPIFMVLYLSIQLRCCNKNKTKMLIKRLTHKKWCLFDFIF